MHDGVIPLCITLNFSKSSYHTSGWGGVMPFVWHWVSKVHLMIRVAFHGLEFLLSTASWAPLGGVILAQSYLKCILIELLTIYSYTVKNEGLFNPSLVTVVLPLLIVSKEGAQNILILLVDLWRKTH